MFFPSFRSHTQDGGASDPSSEEDGVESDLEVRALGRYSQAPLNDRRVHAAFLLLVSRRVMVPALAARIGAGAPNRAPL